MESFGQFKALLTIRKASMSPPSSQAQPNASRQSKNCNDNR